MLSSTENDSSMISISTIKAPLVSKRPVRKVKDLDMVIIKCQRINSHMDVEEIEIEIPANVYNNIEIDDIDCNLARNYKVRKG